jgi:hypothetical protein
MAFWRRSNGRFVATAGQWRASQPLVMWSKKDAFTLNDAFAGVCVMGATGSGKSSGSGRALARAYLRAGFGVLVLAAKSDEASVWETYCRETGRSRDFVRFDASGKYRFDPINYELNRSGEGAGHTENIVSLMSSLLEIADRNSGNGGGGKEDEGYWKRALRQLLRNLVDLIILSKGRVSVPDLYRLVLSAPTSPAQLRDPDWQKDSFLFRSLGEADKRPKTPRQRHDFEIVTDYFLSEFSSLSEKTRSVIVSTFTSMVDVLNRGLLRELFCTDTNITPAAIEEGKVLVVDLSVKEYADVGLFAAILWKHAFQKHIERRNVNQSPRPVALWCDEAQTFVSSYDQQFQTTCRAARVSTVLLSQNLSNYYAVLGGGEKGKALADSMLGNLNTRIFHANGDSVTNEWAASMIGRSRQYMVNVSNSHDAHVLESFHGRSQSTGGVSEIFEYTVQPSAFTKLRTGGPANKYLIDSIIFSNGACFHATGRPHLSCAFSQK